MIKCNVFKFGDAYYLQKDGAAISSVPSSNWVTIMFNFYEIAIIEPTLRENLSLDAHFIDTKIGV